MTTYLSIDFNQFNDDIIQIKNQTMLNAIFDFIARIKKKVDSYNADIDFKLISKKDLLKGLEELKVDILNTQTEFPDRHVNVITTKLIKILELYQQKNFPSSIPLVKSEPSESEKKLKAQQDSVMSGELGKAFNDALAEIKEKMREMKAKVEEKSICIVAAEVGEWNSSAPIPEYLAWVPPFLLNLRNHLQATGLNNIKIIRPQESCGHPPQDMEQIENATTVLLFGTEYLLKKHLSPSYSFLHTQLTHIHRKRIIDNRLGRIGVIPILLSGDIVKSFPAEYASYFIGMWNENDYFLNFCKLLEVLHNVPEKTYHPIWKKFLEKMLKLDTSARAVTAPSVPSAETKEIKQMEFDKIEMPLSPVSIKRDDIIPLDDKTLLLKKSFEMSSSSSSSSETKRELILLMLSEATREALNKTVESIPNPKMKTEVKGFFKSFQELVEEHNKLVQLTERCEILQESFNKLEQLVAAIIAFRCGADVASERRAEAVIRVCRETLLSYKAKAFPAPPKPPEKKEPDRREQHLRLQQKFLNEDTEVKKLFHETLNNISKLMRNNFIFSGQVAIVGSMTGTYSKEYLRWINSFFEILKKHLEIAGISQVELINPQAYASLNLIKSSKTLLLIGSEDISNKPSFAVGDMLDYVHSKRHRDPACKIISLLVSGEKDSLPEVFNNLHDWKNANLYFKNFQNLLSLLYNPKPEIQIKMVALWDEFINKVKHHSEEKALILLSDHDDIANALITSDTERERANEAARKRAADYLLERSFPSSTTTRVRSELQRLAPSAPISSSTSSVSSSSVISTVTPDAVITTQQPSALPFTLDADTVNRNAGLF